MALTNEAFGYCAYHKIKIFCSSKVTLEKVEKINYK